MYGKCSDGATHSIYFAIICSVVCVLSPADKDFKGSKDPVLRNERVLCHWYGVTDVGADSLCEIFEFV